MSGVTCHGSCLMCHVSLVTCGVSHCVCQLSHVIISVTLFDQKSPVHGKRVFPDSTHKHTHTTSEHCYLETELAQKKKKKMAQS